MSAKDGGEHHSGVHHCYRRKFHRRLFAVLFALIILILFTILLIFLILRPTKPRFYLRDVAVSQFDVTGGSSYLSSNLQVTISSANPNGRVGIYYDKLDVYGEYKNQQVTVATGLPVGYLGHDDVAVWSPFLYGSEIPIAPYLAEELVQEESAGLFLIDVKVDGKLRWKVGSWISGRYHIHVNCPAFILVGNGKAKGDDGWGFKFQQTTTCSVDV